MMNAFWTLMGAGFVVLVFAVLQVIVEDRRLRRERNRTEQQKQYDMCRDWIDFR